METIYNFGGREYKSISAHIYKQKITI